jgi:hypothetical protein
MKQKSKQERNCSSEALSCAIPNFLDIFISMKRHACILTRAVLFATLAFVATASLSPSSFADDLYDELEHDLRIGDSNASKKIIKQAYTAKWFEAGSNFSHVFIGKGGPKLLAEWVGAKALGYKMSKVIQSKEEDYAGMKTYIYPIGAKNNTSIQLMILVPHPRSAEARELGVISEFALLEPPSFTPEETIKVTAAGHKGTAYFKADEITILFHLNKGAILHLTVEKRLGLGIMQRYAEQLNFERLNSKLGS